MNPSPMQNMPMQDIPLRDIHLPDAISWWPLAIGWWLLPVIITLCIYGIYQFLKYQKHHKKTAYRKIALAEFNAIRLQFKNNKNSLELIRAISALLRRIALSYLPRENIASLTGEKWIKQLNQLSEQTIFTPEISALLERAPYMQQSDLNTDELLQLCEQWIKSLPASHNSTEMEP